MPKPYCNLLPHRLISFFFTTAQKTKIKLTKTQGLRLRKILPRERIQQKKNPNKTVIFQRNSEPNTLSNTFNITTNHVHD